jgi:rhodanese-related sulfurtransferase
MGAVASAQTIHSIAQRSSSQLRTCRPAPAAILWINLWKLWIAGWLAALLPTRVAARAGPPCQHEVMDAVQVPQAAVAEIPENLDESVIVLDVREHDEWQRGHAPGARHIPMGEVPGRLAEIDPDARLYVVCHLGGRSQRVAEYLARNGYTPTNVSGGMAAWAAAGRPVVTDDGGPGTV